MTQAATPWRQLLRAHRFFLQGAPKEAWWAFIAGWIVLSIILSSVLLYTSLDRQRMLFDQQVAQLIRAINNRLNNCEMVIYGLENVIGNTYNAHQSQLDRFVGQARQRYPFIEALGFQPRLESDQQSRFEARLQRQYGQNFQIRDYRYGPTRSWDSSKNWGMAHGRDSYLPLLSVGPHSQAALGLDLLADPLFAPAVDRAMRSMDIEMTPLIRQPGQPSLIAYLHAIYSPTPPSDSPILRPDEVVGLIVLLVQPEELVNLDTRQSNHLTIRLARQETVFNGLDSVLFLHQARAPTSWFDHLLPQLARRVQIDTSFFPYELSISEQMRLSALPLEKFIILIILAAIPCYLVLLIFAIGSHARRDRESADDSLFLTREHASVTLQAISDAVITLDNNLQVQYLNAAAINMLGVSSEQAIGQPLSHVFKLRYEFARSIVDDPFAACLKKRRICELPENSYLLLANGERLLVEGTVSPLFNRHNTLIGAVLACRDTAPVRRRMLGALEASEARLKQHEQELARVGRIHSMGEMASGIAHEINQPLSAIMSYCQASLSLLEDDSPNLKLIAQAIQSAVNQADRAGKIVLKLREFVSHKALELSPVDINLAVSNVLNLAEYDLRSNDITVEYEPEQQLPLVYADTIQIEQVVLNLVRNAMDSMLANPQGKKLLTVATTLQDGKIQILVGDSGSGIASDNIDHIFSPFFSTKNRGMGLGLTICQTIIESFGGRITVRNQPVGGAEFMIELPPFEVEQIDPLAELEP